MDEKLKTIKIDYSQLMDLRVDYAFKIFAEGNINTGNTGEAIFAKWLSVITEKEINNKAIIENAIEEEEEIMEAVSALARQSEDKYARQAYERRQDEIYFYNKELQDNKRRAEQAEKKIEQAEKKIEQAEAENEKLRQRIAALEANQKT